METFYEIWDGDTNNLVDYYDTEQDALAYVSEFAEMHGHEAVRSWGMLRVRDGRSTLVAAGDDLIARASQQVVHAD